MIDTKDSQDFLMWRTREGYTMEYALLDSYVHTKTSHIAWIQDDVYIPDHVNWNGIGNVTCLRTGTQYCGATAYAFSRAFVSSLLPILHTYIALLPVDWIIDMHSNGTAMRRGIASHMGRVSTNARIRDVD